MIRDRFSLILLLCLLTSCSHDAMEGRLILSGSSTLGPLIAKAVEPWKTLHPRVEVRVEAIGSDAGLERLTRFDDADLALMSRPLTEADKAAARGLGKELLPFPLAWDAVCIVVPTSNTWVTSLSFEQATKAFTTAELWFDLDPSWPAVPIHRFVLGPQSGTSDVFSSALLAGDKSRLYSAPTVQVSEDDRILARGIAQVEGAVGFLGRTTVQESALPLRAVALNGVAPVPGTVQDGSYALPRQFWLVATKEVWKDQTALRSLVTHLYAHYDALLANTSLIPLTPSELTSIEAALGPSP